MFFFLLKKKIQIQNPSAYNTTKFGIDQKQISTNSSVTKFASVSNGTLNTGTGASLLNTSSTNQITNVLNGTQTSSNNNITSNLMRSFLTSSNKPPQQQTSRSYFNHLNSSTNNSANNIFIENNDATSSYTFMPAESLKAVNINNSFNSSSNFYNNSALITASITNNNANNQNSSIRHSNGNIMQMKEKSNAQISMNNTLNGSINDKTSRESSKVQYPQQQLQDKNNSNLRKENSFYVSTKENSAYQNLNTSNLNNTKLLNGTNLNNNNNTILDSTLISNSMYANGSNMSINSHATVQQSQQNRSSNLINHRGVLSSKQLNNQSTNNAHKNDYLTSTGRSKFKDAILKLFNFNFFV